VPADGAPGKYSYRLRVFDPDAPGENYTDGDPVYFEVPAKKEKVAPKKENGGKPFKWWIPAAIAAGVIVIGVVVWLAWPSGIKLPDFTRMDLASAEKFLNDQKITYTKVVKVDPQAKNEIIDQDPDPQTKVKEGDRVTLTIASGIELPDFTRMDLASAEEFIKENGLKGKFEVQPDPNPKSGKEILGQAPEPGTKLKEGAIVNIKIAGIRAPQFRGLSFSTALQRISSNMLTFNDKSDLRIRNVSRADQHEKVLDQNPRPGQVVAKNSAMKLTVGRLARKKFVFKQLPRVKMMPGIKMSPAFIKREVEPAPE
jgi:beta-lactam-binding protein with PASTA domain